MFWANENGLKSAYVRNFSIFVPFNQIIKKLKAEYVSTKNQSG